MENKILKAIKPEYTESLLIESPQGIEPVMQINRNNLLRIINSGLLYAGDYNTNYTDQSLVNKEYVDDQIEEITSQLKREFDDRERYLIEIASYILTI